jgi:hypothetical protein
MNASRVLFLSRQRLTLQQVELLLDASRAKDIPVPKGLSERIT